MTRFVPGLVVILCLVITLSLIPNTQSLTAHAQGPIDGAVATIAVATQQARANQAAWAATQQAIQSQAIATRQANDAAATYAAIESTAQAAQVQASATRSAIDAAATVQANQASAAATATSDAAAASRLQWQITATAHAVQAAQTQADTNLKNTLTLFLAAAIIALLIITLPFRRRPPIHNTQSPIPNTNLPPTRVVFDPALAQRIKNELENQP